ncbi:MAG: DNA polymerase III subunit delta [Microcystis sp. LE19-338.1B]|jgi:DNA polymerase-3 subunit delta|nr:DNA polymerase III subunit delta [Microcystis sp. LE19-338.1B]MCZ8351820.1 DNA polymerase III subunit delta [Rhizobium sp.]
MLYLITGSDRFRVQEATAAILKQQQAQREVFIDGELSAAVAAAMTPALFGKIAAVYSAKCLKSESEEILKCTSPDLPNPLILEVESLDGRTRIAKALKAKAQCQQFDLIPNWDCKALTAEALRRSRSLGLTLTTDCLDYLVEAVGNNIGRMQQELELLATYSPTVTLGTLQVLIPNLAQSAFQMADSLRTGDAASTIEICRGLIQRNIHPLEILGALVAQCERWLKVRAALDAGKADRNEIAAFAGIANPNQIYYLSQEVASLEFKHLSGFLVALHDLQHQCKRGLERERLPLKLAVLASFRGS